MSDRKYLSVTDVNKIVQDDLKNEPHLQKIFMTGEISNYRYRPGGHQYFSLKDDNTKIDAVMFRGFFQRVQFKPKDGMKVNVFGSVGTYPRFGEYQFYVWAMEPAGLGAKYEALIQVRHRLQQQGMFNPALKKQLPKFPKRIAVITSRNGAVIRDIIVTARRRYPLVQIVLFPASVQGPASEDSLVKQVHNVEHDGHFDDLIIGRGGGSLEDLWGFEGPKIATALFNCPIPVISSVGHETDVATTDMVADRRAATPTAAAEYATPIRLADIINDISNYRERIIQAFKNKITDLHQQLLHVQSSYIFTDPKRLYKAYTQQVNGLTQNLHTLLSNYSEHYSNVLDTSRQKLFSNFKFEIQNKRISMQKLVGALDQLSPLKVMSHGYSLISKNGRLIKRTQDVHVGDIVSLRLSNGKRRAKIIASNKKYHSSIKAKPYQLDLFGKGKK